VDTEKHAYHYYHPKFSLENRANHGARHKIKKAPQKNWSSFTIAVKHMSVLFRYC